MPVLYYRDPLLGQWVPLSMQGRPGLPGPVAVSADAGNAATIGNDGLLYVPPIGAADEVLIQSMAPVAVIGLDLWVDPDASLGQAGAASRDYVDTANAAQDVAIAAAQSTADGKVSKTGDTMTGNLNLGWFSAQNGGDMGTSRITGVGAPVAPSDAATKGYVDLLTGGRKFAVGQVLTDANAEARLDFQAGTFTGVPYVFMTGWNPNLIMAFGVKEVTKDYVIIRAIYCSPATPSSWAIANNGFRFDILAIGT